MVFAKPLKYRGTHGRLSSSTARAKEAQESSPLRIRWVHSNYLCICLANAQTQKRQTSLRICYRLDGFLCCGRNPLQHVSLSAMWEMVLLHLVVSQQFCAPMRSLQASPVLHERGSDRALNAQCPVSGAGSTGRCNTTCYKSFPKRWCS